MRERITLVRCLAGDCINAALVYRWFITQNATKGGWDVCASVHGPQNPYTVVRCETEELAGTSLDNLLSAIGMFVITPRLIPIPDLPVTGERGALDP